MFQGFPSYSCGICLLCSSTCILHFTFSHAALEFHKDVLQGWFVKTHIPAPIVPDYIQKVSLPTGNFLWFWPSESKCERSSKCSGFEVSVRVCVTLLLKWAPTLCCTTGWTWVSSWSLNLSSVCCKPNIFPSPSSFSAWNLTKCSQQKQKKPKQTLKCPWL